AVGASARAAGRAPVRAEDVHVRIDAEDELAARASEEQGREEASHHRPPTWTPTARGPTVGARCSNVRAEAVRREVRKRTPAVTKAAPLTAKPTSAPQAAVFASRSRDAPVLVHPAGWHCDSLSRFLFSATTPKALPTPAPTTAVPSSTQAATGG